MSTISLHFTKRKITQVNGIGRHVERIIGERHSNKNIDNSRTKDNITLFGGRKEGTYYKRIKTQIERKYTGKRAIRKDAVVMISSTIQFGGSMQEASEIEQVRVLTDCYDWLSNRFGSCNVLGSSIHLDETNPHLHFDFMPWSDGKLQAKNIINREGLKSAQEDLLVYVQGKYPEFNFKRMSESLRGFSNGKSQEDFEKLKDVQREAVATVQEALNCVKYTAKEMDNKFKCMNFEYNSKSTELLKRENELEQKRVQDNNIFRQKMLLVKQKNEEADESKRLASRILEQYEQLRIDLANRWQRILGNVREGALRVEKVEEQIKKRDSKMEIEDVEEVLLELEKMLEKSNNKGLSL